MASLLKQHPGQSAQEEDAVPRGRHSAPSKSKPGRRLRFDTTSHQLGSVGDEDLPSGLDGQRLKPKRERRPSGSIVAPPRTWLKIATTGATEELTGDKRQLAQALGLQHRELRFLDPQTAAMSTATTANERYSMIGAPPPAAAAAMASSISGRKGAILVNLEFIKCVVTCDVVYVLNMDYPQVPYLITDLETRLATPSDQQQPAVPVLSANRANTRTLSAPPAGGAALPFELRALEICLDMITFHLDALTSDLEVMAFPALDGFVHAATAKHLERVRRIKNALMQLLTRVENVSGVLEKLLADDKDMYHLNLTAVALENSLARNSLTRHSLGRKSRRRSIASGGGTLGGGGPASPGAGAGGGSSGAGDGGSSLSGVPPQGGGSSSGGAYYYPGYGAHGLARWSRGGGGGGGSSRSSSSGASSFLMSEEAKAVAHVEMLVETYFMRVDQTHNRLQILHDYIGDTEDLVNTQLDQHRNRLITVDLFLTALMAALSTMTCIGGFFGVNLNSTLQEAIPTFTVVTTVVAGGALCLFALFCFLMLRLGIVEF